MWNITKSIVYQFRRDILMYCTVFLSCGLIVMMLSGYIVPISENESGAEFFADAAAFMTFSLVSPLILFVTRIMGWDFNDKTINYEIAVGHSRSQVYFARVIWSLVIGVVSGVVILTAPNIIIGVKNGWGENMPLSAAVLRYILAVLPVFRMVCEIILITVLVKNCYVGMIFSFLYFEITSTVFDIILNFNHRNNEHSLYNAIFSMASLNDVLTVSNYKLGFVNGEDIELYETALSPEYIVTISLASLTVGALCIWLGWLNFKKSDLK